MTDAYDSGYMPFMLVGPETEVPVTEGTPLSKYRRVQPGEPVRSRKVWAEVAQRFPQRWIAGIDQPIDSWVKRERPRPSEAEMLLEVASVVAKRSTCNRRQVGAVFALDGRILSTGYNGAPAGMPHCGSECAVEATGCEKAIHAEANAIAWAARNGVRLENADCFLTLSPCRPCAQLLIQTGVLRVHYIEQYRDMAGLELLWEAGIYTKLVSIGQA